MLKTQTNLILSFDFPRHLRPHYHHYILYFGQVLFQHKIESEVSIIEPGANNKLLKSKNTHLIINVDESLLSKVELSKMLLAYLALPSFHESEIKYDNFQVFTEQMLVNVKHFRTQLFLSQAESQDYFLIGLLDKISRSEIEKEIFSESKNLTYKLLGIEVKLNKKVLF